MTAVAHTHAPHPDWVAVAIARPQTIGHTQPQTNVLMLLRPNRLVFVSAYNVRWNKIRGHNLPKNLSLMRVRRISDCLSSRMKNLRVETHCANRSVHYISIETNQMKQNSCSLPVAHRFARRMFMLAVLHLCRKAIEIVSQCLRSSLISGDFVRNWRKAIRVARRFSDISRRLARWARIMPSLQFVTDLKL